MEIGLQLSDFTWPGGATTLSADLAETAQAADEAGFGYLAVMDHLFQIPGVGPVEHEMLEAYTTLGFLAGCTRRVRLLTVVSGASACRSRRWPGGSSCWRTCSGGARGAGDGRWQR
jgi:alkanesulfonate monooxygenase SsuD/methylene tetrahydromethanopterin reductase-like flavin-dependent oxidoreductase (luciferase family)